MRPPVDELTDQSITERLAFALRLETMPNGSYKALPKHLQQEKDELIEEQARRVGGKTRRIDLDL